MEKKDDFYLDVYTSSIFTTNIRLPLNDFSFYSALYISWKGLPQKSQNHTTVQFRFHGMPKVINCNSHPFHWLHFGEVNLNSLFSFTNWLH